jgi:hypothetical protein
MTKHRATTEEEPGHILAAMADLNAQAAAVSARLHADVAALALLQRQMAELVVRLCTTPQHPAQVPPSTPARMLANSRRGATCWSRSIYGLAHGAREDLSRSAATRPSGRRVDRGGYRQLGAQPTAVVSTCLSRRALKNGAEVPISESVGYLGVTGCARRTRFV